MTRSILAAAALMFVAGTANAQLIINEVFENPPNGGDQTWEFIEIYGPPNYDLTGYMVALVKGGEDNNPADEIPDGALHQKTAEIDEAFTLDGWKTDANGVFVLYNTGDFNATGLSPFLTPNPTYAFFRPESPTNKRFLNGASFDTLFIPSVFDPIEVADRLNNDGSSSYLLIRRRPNHALSTTGASVYLPGYAWAKDTSPDIDFNSRLDFGDEHTLGVPFYFSEGANGAQVAAVALEPVQIVDEIAWSNAGGKEYNTPGRGNASGKFSQTPGFNPDLVARVRYLVTPPTLGWAIDEDDNVVDRRNTADESWLYGETNNVNPGTADYGKFKPGPVDQLVPTELVWLAPTDPNGHTYTFHTGDLNNPFVAPFFENSTSLDPNGDLLVEPYNITGVRITPGTLNDAQAGTPLIGTAIQTQTRYVRGDFNFDRVVGCADRALIAQALAEGWTLDDTTTLVNDRNTLTPADDVAYTGLRWRVDGYNTLLAMIRMSLTDGSTGEWTSGQIIDNTAGSPSFGRIIGWGGVVTAQDLAAFDAEFPLTCPPPCAADFNRSGTATVQDIFDFLSAYFSNDPRADINGAGGVTVQDIFDFLAAYFAGCP